MRIAVFARLCGIALIAGTATVPAAAQSDASRLRVPAQALSASNLQEDMDGDDSLNWAIAAGAVGAIALGAVLLIDDNEDEPESP